MTERSIAHGSFTVERHLDASPARVFQAWADPGQKKQWFPESTDPAVFDFREGGREYNVGKVGDDDFAFDCTYRDIVENNRIVYEYETHLNGQRISVSVAAIELKPEGSGTRLVVTEHGVFLDGLDDVERRRTGTAHLMDQLAGYVNQQ